MTAVAQSPALDELIRRLDAATRQGDDEAIVQDVKQALMEVAAGGRLQLDPEFLRPAAERYARRLLHLDPSGRYSLLVMVWDRGQGTKLHDHGGNWCVECVYQGEIEVTSDSMTGGDAARGIVHFQEETRIRAGQGEAGALIPPFEHHILRNAGDTPAVTLHVYSHELTSCHVFEPVDGGGWRRKYVELSYTP